MSGAGAHSPEAPRPQLRAEDIEPHPAKAPRFDALPVSHPGGARRWDTRRPGDRTWG